VSVKLGAKAWLRQQAVIIYSFTALLNFSMDNI
jgi:hypothetical protein